MAGIRSGLVDFSCDRCDEAPYVRENLGCEKPAQIPADWFGTNEEWYNCPIKFLMSSVNEFFDKYDLYKSGLATPPDYDLQSAKFILAVRIYESYLGKFIEEKKHGN